MPEYKYPPTAHEAALHLWQQALDATLEIMLDTKPQLTEFTSSLQLRDGERIRFTIRRDASDDVICFWGSPIESKVICGYCGDDRTGKGSLIWNGRSFCNDDHFEEWHALVLAKHDE